MFCVEWISNQLNKSGGVPERLIGAVLKTVERASVPWVRIPPPPNLKATLKGGFFSVISITRHLKLKCLTLKIKNFKFASNLRENF